MGQSKRCGTCKQSKPLTAFYKNRARSDGYSSRCKACKLEREGEAAKARRRRWYEANRQRQLDMNLLRVHGLTRDDWNSILAAQGGVCAICGGLPAEGKTFHVDHCHVEGHVRGLLCPPCNSGIGHLGDDPERVRSALHYLTTTRPFTRTITADHFRST